MHPHRHAPRLLLLLLLSGAASVLGQAQAHSGNHPRHAPARAKTQAPTVLTPATPAPSLVPPPPYAKPNFLILIADDYSPLTYPKASFTPNIAKLMSRGTSFVNAYSNFPVCGPSRQSFMSGRLPDTTQIWNFERWLPEAHPTATTIGRYFKNNLGYDTLGMGKVYHDAQLTVAREGQGQLWFRTGHWTFRNEAQLYSGDTECGTQWSCTLLTSALCDTLTSSMASSWLLSRPADGPRPFALFVGLRRPHESLAVRAQDLASAPTDVPDPISSLPMSIDRNGSAVPFRRSFQRFSCYNEIQGRFVGARPLDPIDRFAADPSLHGVLRFMRRTYVAAVGWMDTRVGVVMDALQRSAFANNTVVIFFADHGYAIGEHGIFCKNALFEQHTRVPFVLVPAGGGAAKQVADPVSLIDLFPTMLHLATGLRPALGANLDASSLPLDGSSLADPMQRSAYAFMQYPRCENISYRAMCMRSTVAALPCGRAPITFMGYSVRSAENLRYTEWRPFVETPSTCAKPVWPGQQVFLSAQFAVRKNFVPETTGTVWSAGVEQRELFDDYQAESNTANWEQANALLQVPGAALRAATIRALEHSAAIRWMFDPNFAAGKRGLPCSNHGMVRLLHNTSWALNQWPAPKRSDVVCECLPGWKGLECDGVGA